jgi:hypothetical protein
LEKPTGQNGDSDSAPSRADLGPGRGEAGRAGAQPTALVHHSGVHRRPGEGSVGRGTRFVRTVEVALVWLHDVGLFVLLRVALIEVRFEKIRDRQVPVAHRHNDQIPVNVDKAQAEFLYKLAREDSASTDDKVKQLLTLSSSLATLALVFGRDARPKVLFVCFVAALVAAVVLCLSVLEVRRGQVPTLEESGTEASSRWGNDLYDSYRVNRKLHYSRADRYLAALRYFRVALLVLLILAVTTPRPPNPAYSVAQAIRGIAIPMPCASWAPTLLRPMIPPPSDSPAARSTPIQPKSNPNRVPESSPQHRPRVKTRPSIENQPEPRPMPQMPKPRPDSTAKVHFQCVDTIWRDS